MVGVDVGLPNGHPGTTSAHLAGHRRRCSSASHKSLDEDLEQLEGLAQVRPDTLSCGGHALLEARANEVLPHEPEPLAGKA